MQYGEVISLLDETGFSPENLAQWLSLSASTCRRWLKEPQNSAFPEEYYSNVADAVYKLLENKHLSYDSARVNKFLEKYTPEFFKAAIGRINSTEDLYAEHSTHQDKIMAVLSNLGNSSSVRNKVDKSSKAIRKFTEWGTAWKYRIKLLSGILVAKELTLIDRLVAYGALFYLILPFDLVPDTIPVFGYVDDFGILGFAAAYYARQYPKITVLNADGTVLSENESPA
jgi:uncharacterized membrane protein YkvA (DUF1232 family)